MRRIVLVLAAVLVLGGCTPAGESYETAVPAALVASDLGITDAEATSSIDGLAVDYSVFITFDRDTVTAAEVREALELIVTNTGSTDFNSFVLSGLDGSAAERTYVTLDGDLGFESHSSATDLINASWDDIVALTDN